MVYVFDGLLKHAGLHFEQGAVVVETVLHLIVVQVTIRVVVLHCLAEMLRHFVVFGTTHHEVRCLLRHWFREGGNSRIHQFNRHAHTVARCLVCQTFCQDGAGRAERSTVHLLIERDGLCVIFLGNEDLRFLQLVLRERHLSLLLLVVSFGVALSLPSLGEGFVDVFQSQVVAPLLVRCLRLVKQLRVDG